MDDWAIGVFASVDAGLGVKWDVISELGLPTIQLHAPHQGQRSAADAEKLKQQLDQMGVQCTAVFGGFEGESYADIPTVVQTIGLVPQASRESRFREMCEISDFSKALGCDTIALHLGFIPEDSSDPQYDAVVAITAKLCDYCNENGQFLHLETGQETAEGLIEFIAAVGCSNLKINFDPANMILYGTGEPIEALRLLAPHVRSVHCKDGTWSDQPGKTWGCEVPLGQGDVNIEAYLKTLHEIGYSGPLTIEREIPEDPERQKAEIGGAIELLSRLRSEILG
ncbi:sugar phosphate isomerase/epimerase family protein [Roseiconus lacunae]|uniref:Sugar phosphate isomerase/epimerase family protein n=1 Tax=Roseiconus lacunae TaxID=2605694 RepID=A0ABT7PD92_9BACT|nr:sugar phosphate isomerase/epimerase family protein [Roseiconus lacunae]MCD0459751.1 sugar phosphate isomerase/epimerase [Roseiconus lacunae]MDM4014448.1 sugar phosphate isomerase/epimerase family protein [Roseiconus lacunae]WRQ49763.1 sugar phosphate isomerase/epimerase family protein [Stieleria sp. HD01]